MSNPPGGPERARGVRYNSSMPVDFTRACLWTAVALAGGAGLGYVVATRFDGLRRWAEFLLWLALLLPFAGPAMSIAPVALFASWGFQRAEEQRNAARSLGASDWRIFWRILLPNAWRRIAEGTVLAVVRTAVVFGLMARV